MHTLEFVLQKLLASGSSPTPSCPHWPQHSTSCSERAAQSALRRPASQGGRRTPPPPPRQTPFPHCCAMQASLSLRAVEATEGTPQVRGASEARLSSLADLATHVTHCLARGAALSAGSCGDVIIPPPHSGTLSRGCPCKRLPTLRSKLRRPRPARHGPSLRRRPPRRAPAGC